MVRFSWNLENGKRERGVFKVLKPHIPEYFAEDMDDLQGLAQYFWTGNIIMDFPRTRFPILSRKSGGCCGTK